MDQFLHAGQHLVFGGQNRLAIGDVHRFLGLVAVATRQFVQALAEQMDALPHFLNPAQVTIITIAHRTQRHLKFQLVVNQIRMRFAQIKIHPAAAQVRPGQTVINRRLARNHPDVAVAVHENLVPGQKLFRLVNVDYDFSEELAALSDPAFGEIARNPADARVSGGETRPGQGLDQIINLLPFSESVEEDG